MQKIQEFEFVVLHHLGSKTIARVPWLAVGTLRASAPRSRSATTADGAVRPRAAVTAAAAWGRPRARIPGRAVP